MPTGDGSGSASDNGAAALLQSLLGQWSTKGRKFTAVAEGFTPLATATTAEGILSRGPNVRLKVKPASEGHKVEKSAILYEKIEF